MQHDQFAHRRTSRKEELYDAVKKYLRENTVPRFDPQSTPFHMGRLQAYHDLLIWMEHKERQS